MSGVGFLYSGGPWFLFIVEVSLSGVGLDDWFVKVSWLGKLVSVFWYVKLDFLSLECSAVPSNEFCDGSMYYV